MPLVGLALMHHLCRHICFYLAFASHLLLPLLVPPAVCWRRVASPLSSWSQAFIGRMHSTHAPCTCLCELQVEFNRNGVPVRASG